MFSTDKYCQSPLYKHILWSHVKISTHEHTFTRVNFVWHQTPSKTKALKFRTLGKTPGNVECPTFLNIKILQIWWCFESHKSSLQFPPFSNYELDCFWNLEFVGEWSATWFIKIISVQEHYDTTSMDFSEILQHVIGVFNLFKHVLPPL